MGSVNRRRLERLEQQRSPQPAHEPMKPMSEAQEKERWLVSAKTRRIHENRDPGEQHVRGIIKLLLPRGEFDGMDLEEFRDRLRAWRPPLDESAIERITARMSYYRQPPATDMACPPEWHESFEAADELRERYLAVPPETLAGIFVAASDLQKGESKDGRVEEQLADELESWGITAELEREAVGPDSDEIPEEERERRLREALSDLYYGEKGFYVQQHIIRILEERNVEHE